MIVEWNGKEYTDIYHYYKEVILSMPQTDGVILGAQTHLDAMAALSRGGLFVCEPDEGDIYVDCWDVSGPFLTHKHPEFGVVVDMGWTKGMVESDVWQGKCELCGKKIPGEIEMMYHFYRLDG